MGSSSQAVPPYRVTPKTVPAGSLHGTGDSRWVESIVRNAPRGNAYTLLTTRSHGYYETGAKWPQEIGN